MSNAGKITPDFRTLLQRKLTECCRANPAYSLRAFAKQLGLEPSFLSKILSSKRSVTPTLISKVARKVGLNPTQTQYYLLKAQRKRTKSALALEKVKYGDLTLDQFQIIADWHHYAILELIEVEGFSGSPRWIARKLGIGKKKAQSALERLARLGLIEIRDSIVRKTGAGHTTVGSAFTAAAFRKLQSQILRQAEVAMRTLPIETRDQSSITMAVHTDLIDEAKERIKRFRRELCAFLKQDGLPKKEVYQLSISLFPVSRASSEGDDASR